MSTNTKTVEEHYAFAEVAKKLAVSRTSIWRLVQRWRKTDGKEGIGPVVLIGSSPRLSATAVNGYLARRVI